MLKRLSGVALAAGAASVALVLGGPVPASSTPPAEDLSTTTSWNTAPKSSGTAGASRGQVLTNVRGVGRNYEPTMRRHFDRLVVDTVSATRSREVNFVARYVKQVYADGSGQLMPLSAPYKLQLIVRAPAYNEAYQATYRATVGRDLPGVADGARIVDTVYAGSFEGQTTFGVGVTAKRPFRVVALDDGRTAVDVLH
jgi:hypothetical protein